MKELNISVKPLVNHLHTIKNLYVLIRLLLSNPQIHISRIRRNSVESTNKIPTKFWPMVPTKFWRTLPPTNQRTCIKSKISRGFLCRYSRLFRRNSDGRKVRGSLRRNFVGIFHFTREEYLRNHFINRHKNFLYMWNIFIKCFIIFNIYKTF